jgi:DNA-binding XRE family transcriptional regulator
MALGEKIRSNRTRMNLTQKDLAEKVNVTAQAVSRWEQDIVEPSIGTLKQLANIFSVSLDEFLSNATPPVSPPIQNNAPTFNPQVVDSRRSIGVCEHCNKPILEGDPIHRHRLSYGRSAHTLILCEGCNQKREMTILNEYKRVTRKKRFWGLFWGILFGGFFLYTSINGLQTGSLEVDSFWVGIGLSYTLFAFFFTYTMKNNFIHNFFWEVTSWGFVKLPGVIFSFSIDGLLFLIAAKVILFFIGLGIALVAGFVALILSLLMAGIVFPFSITNSFINPRKTQINI